MIWGIDPPSHGNLESWAKNGVLLLNTVLTVRRGAAGSHRGQGWEVFTDQVIQHLNAREKPMVFILWGGFAKAKEALITGKQHCIIKSVHPSPLSAHRGYFGGKYFSRTNAFLRDLQGRNPSTGAFRNSSTAPPSVPAPQRIRRCRRPLQR